MKFKSIAYGKDAKIDEILKPMAEEFGGTAEEVLRPDMLSQAFIEMIPNLYAQK